MADSQVPWGFDALNGAVTEPAWRSKPSWYLVSTDDKMIPLDAQRAMSRGVHRPGSTDLTPQSCRSDGRRSLHLAARGESWFKRAYGEQFKGHQPTEKWEVARCRRSEAPTCRRGGCSSDGQSSGHAQVPAQ